MKCLAYILLFLILACAATAQVPHPNMLSLKGYGGNNVDQVASNVTATRDGGFIICIESSSDWGTGNIDSFCTSGPLGDIFLKYNSNASILEWSFCTTNGSFLFPIDSGNFILGGITDPAATGWAYKICKMDASASIIWRKTYGDSASAILRSMIATTDGGYILLGEINYTDADFPIHYGSFMNADFGVIKVDGYGNKVWSRVIGGTGDQSAGELVPAPNNGCYLVGSTTSDDYDCTGNHGDSSGTQDAYLARLDSNGNILWHRDLGGSGQDGASSGWPDGHGGIIIGATGGSLDGDITHCIYGGSSFWALDVDSSGNILWNNSYGGGGNENALTICKATDGTIWLGGETIGQGGEVDTFYDRLNYDAWFVHADSAGNFLSEKVLGSTDVDEGRLIYPLSDGNVLAGGIYGAGTGSFDTIRYYGIGAGPGNAFLAEFEPTPMGIVSVSLLTFPIQVIPNPADNVIEVIMPLNNYNVKIKNIYGKIVFDNLYNHVSETTISLDKLPRGMYFIVIKDDNDNQTIKKIILQ